MKQTTFNVYRQRMAEGLLVIQRHLDENLALEELARVAHFSPYHFHRIFRGMVGESVQTIGGGEYAVTTHEGPYERLNQTYARLFGQWLPHSGREVRSEPCLEFYLNDPDGTSPEELLTDIYAPLEPKS